MPPTMGTTVRTLSKSDFKLARGCEAKLYFRENGYPDNRGMNPYLILLAEGGYMVEALAKAKYADGVQVDYTGGALEGFEVTKKLLERENVTLFEPTFLSGRRQARVDILQKRGNVVRLLEVKAGSFDGAAHLASFADGDYGAFRTTRKPFGVRSEWRDYIEDVAFQMLILERVMPGVTIVPHLVLVDTSKAAQIDDIPSLFEIVETHDSAGVRRLHTAHYRGTPELIPSLDLVTEVDVSAEVALLRDEVDAAAAAFESKLDAPLTVYTTGLERGSKCSNCEFAIDESGEPNGFNECWGELAGAKPHMLELFSIGRARSPEGGDLISWMTAQKKASLLDIPFDGLVKKDGTPGVNTERQKRQIEYTRRNETYVSPKLREEIAKLAGPLHFIDFETSRLALPYHKKMRPYGVVTFQWSCHTTPSLGAAPVHKEWLNDVEIWPNKSFVESLRDAVGEDGPILTWSHFERTTLRQVIEDFPRFSISDPALEQWVSRARDRIVDLHDWARTLYYTPGMKGRTSIKVVLDAMWQSDAAMRAQFEQWTGLTATDRDPYAALPSVIIGGKEQDVHEGTGAMRAYQEMMYGVSKTDAEARRKWGELLKQYCKLDTLSMVLILEHWRRVV